MGLHVIDTEPLLTASATSANAAVNLTGSTVAFHLSKPSGATVTLAASIDSPTDGGKVTGAAWSTIGGIDEAGPWTVELQVTYSGGGIQTFGPTVFRVKPEIG